MNYFKIFMNEKEKFPGVSITISTYNQTKQIEEIVQKTLDQDYPKNKIEVIVIDDGSPDNTMEILKKFGKKIRVIQTYRKGRVQALNKAIKEAKFDFVCLSAGDIFFEKDFLKTIMSYFKSEKIAFVSPFSETGGNATVHRKKALIEAGLFDLNYNEPDPKSETETGWRDDTDLAFKEWDLGYKSIFTYAVAKFKHEHQAPANFKGKIKYVWGRIKNHRFDVLLYKKHPERAKEFLHISFGFWINPMRDF